MRFFYCLLFILIFSAMAANAQTITGSVRGSDESLNGAVIENLKNKTISVSDTKGNFSIKAIIGDTLVISYVSYRADTLKVKTGAFMTIVLEPENITLNEVTINGRHLTPLERYLKNQVEYKEIYRIGNDSNLFFAGGGLGNGGIGLNIDALYSALSKQGKDARRMQATLTNDYHTDVVDSRFSIELVGKITGYSGKQLEDFIVNNKPSYDFIIRASDYDIIQYIQRRMKGVVMATDNPAPIKTSSPGLKIKFGTTNTSVYDHPAGTQFVPIERP